jgi:hypothetical protein
MFSAVTADLLLFQATVAALRDEGVLTMHSVDRVADDARARLKAYDAPAFTPKMVTHIAKQLDSLVEQLRAALPEQPEAPSKKAERDGEDSGDGRA